MVDHASQSSMLLRYALWLVGLLCTARVLLFLYMSLTSPLRSVPGPFFARFGRVYYFWKVSRGHWEHDNLALHRKYGPVVRVASDMYSIDSPEIVKKVYSVGSKFPKSDWYDAWKHPDPSRWSLFPERDMKRHAETRKRFQAMYSMSSLVNYEGYVDECAEIFCKRLAGFAAHGDTIDMAHWLQCYAFDVIGDITYSQRFGFLDKGEDIAGLLRALHGVLKYGTLAGIYARWHPLIFRISNRLGLGGATGRTYLMKFVGERIRQREKETKTGKDVQKAGQRNEKSPMDFLEKLVVANKEDPERVTPYHVFMMGLSNIIAGSDTTAVSLSSILYNLLKHPAKIRKLQQEIKEFDDQGRCSNPNVSFKESQEMPYLQAVMKEALRVHPATGLPLWRVVPRGGVELCGQFFPEGSIVGVNTWCAHYNEVVFGPDAKEFRPERWIDNEEQGGERLKRMEAYYMPFGLGSRTCIGRHISFLEMSKLIPQIVRRFDFELEHAERPWNTDNNWFVKPTDFQVKVKLRNE
ncbi:cytochrome P450 oxidoreductase [Capronia epimyces CBS 606.96]|uniref:Cytochrome P450 oxidoreductase n=1 Tax=Capronia epimyces CBS 606.96 TaxID=1182542 RepID=W9ZDS7_9EURO|nr:cytochrome P450 oxidoreductase [Capronia epimyces CBS 606.96]EXJ92679.1 cytochrome P450 oxidoreductase [Capronia epimyces CBS 606.96]